MSKILVLFCGGTIIMKSGPEGALIVSGSTEALSLLAQLEPRIKEVAEIEIVYISNIDSSNMTPDIWNELTTTIAKNYDAYDGFVIAHGTDTLAYTASALTFSLQNLGKPVVFTGSQIPGNQIESDARGNFLNAVRLATMDIAGVYVVFHDKIILGARSSKVSESRLEAFCTKNAPDIGEIRIDIRLQETIAKRKNTFFQARAGFEADILVVTVFPGRSRESLLRIIENNQTKGLIIRAYASGNMPYDFLPVLEKSTAKKIPVVVTSQCLHGSTAMHRYDVGNQALKQNVIEVYDMSIECATTKFMWALKHFPYEQIREVMQKNFMGEINMGGNLYE